MAKKGFGLERVLGFRKEVEKMRKLDFSIARQEFDVAEKRLRGEEEKMDCVNLEFMEKQVQGMNADEMRIYADFMRSKKTEITRQREMLVRLEEDMSGKRASLLEAAKEKKALEGLKVKKVRAFEKEALDKERAFLDEITLQKRGRNQG